MEVKQTLLMPKTSFEMRGNLPSKEPKYREKWENEKLYNKMLESNKGNTPFILHDGPPYANGDMHIGHALNKTLKDFVVRYKSMSGYYTPFTPGWDTHGLPIENAVIKQGVNRKTTPVVEFRNKCEEYAYKQVARQMQQQKTLGLMADYDDPYLTLQHEFEAEEVDMFATLALKGLKPCSSNKNGFVIKLELSSEKLGFTSYEDELDKIKGITLSSRDKIETGQNKVIPCFASF